jgi:hypothetical protein
MWLSGLGRQPRQSRETCPPLPPCDLYRLHRQTVCSARHLTRGSRSRREHAGERARRLLGRRVSRWPQRAMNMMGGFAGAPAGLSFGLLTGLPAGAPARAPFMVQASPNSAVQPALLYLGVGGASSRPYGRPTPLCSLRSCTLGLEACPRPHGRPPPRPGGTGKWGRGLVCAAEGADSGCEAG